MTAGVCPAYLPSIRYMAWIVAKKEVTFVLTNQYQKQTYRNRTEIYGANGKLKLTIPISHNKFQTLARQRSLIYHYLIRL